MIFELSSRERARHVAQLNHGLRDVSREDDCEEHRPEQCDEAGGYDVLARLVEDLVERRHLDADSHDSFFRLDRDIQVRASVSIRRIDRDSNLPGGCLLHFGAIGAGPGFFRRQCGRALVGDDDPVEIHQRDASSQRFAGVSCRIMRSLATRPVSTDEKCFAAQLRGALADNPVLEPHVHNRHDERSHDRHQREGENQQPVDESHLGGALSGDNL